MTPSRDIGRLLAIMAALRTPKCPSENILNPLNRFDSKEVT